MASPLVTQLLEAVLAACADDRSGASMDPVPELRTIDPDAFGICLATADGHLYEAGDSRARFPIQSISKPFTYGIALEDRGADAVAAKIDVEPSGEPFNEISLDRHTGRARNPMINAGAITAASLVSGATPAEQFARVRSAYSAYAGRELELSEHVLEAEIRVGDRNRAIGYLLRELGTLEGDPIDALDVYLRQCSLLVDCRDLALMGATLATGGLAPRTGERLMAVDSADRVLSVMTTCGMYDAAGDWVAEVGLPAKSGVGGGIMAVLPGQLAIAVFSPRLDAHGNSVRGVAACRRLSRELELHFLHVPRGARTAVVNVKDVAAAPSLRQRAPAAERELDRVAHRAQIFELRGDLLFAGAEAIVRRAEEAAPEVDVLVFDTSRVGDVSDATWRLLLALRGRLDEHGCEIAIVGTGEALALHDAGDPPPVFSSLEAATAWAEDRLLARHGAAPSGHGSIALADHPLVAALGSDVAPYFETRAVAEHRRVVDAGDPPTGLHLLLAGQARTSLPGSAARLATLLPGTSFGQAALATDRPHLFTVDAELPCELAVLTPQAFARLASERPALHGELMQFLLREAYDMASRMLARGAPRDESIEH